MESLGKKKSRITENNSDKDDRNREGKILVYTLKRHTEVEEEKEMMGLYIDILRGKLPGSRLENLG